MRSRRRTISEATALAESERFVETIEPPPRFEGRGIVICAGGDCYFTSACISIRLLREFGCLLPIQVWYLSRSELTPRMERLLRPFDVECVNASRVRRRHPIRCLYGWELKAYAIVRSPFREVLLMDADNLAVTDPEFLFEEPEYRITGAAFWPDKNPLHRDQPLWRIFGVRYRDEPSFESGQVVVDKQRCYRALRLALWYNENSDFFYHYVHGDKDTFHLAFRRLRVRYAMTPFPVVHEHPVLFQHDFQGSRLFQHGKKWSCAGRNPRHPNLWHQETCFRFLHELRRQWDGRLPGRLM